jgi:hypothetical protein
VEALVRARRLPLGAGSDRLEPSRQLLNHSSQGGSVLRLRQTRQFGVGRLEDPRGGGFGCLWMVPGWNSSLADPVSQLVPVPCGVFAFGLERRASKLAAHGAGRARLCATPPLEGLPVPGKRSARPSLWVEVAAALSSRVDFAPGPDNSGKRLGRATRLPSCPTPNPVLLLRDGPPRYDHHMHALRV